MVRIVQTIIERRYADIEKKNTVERLYTAILGVLKFGRVFFFIFFSENMDGVKTISLTDAFAFLDDLRDVQ